MRNSISSQILHREFSKVESKIELLESRQKSNSRPFLENSSYSKIDNKENHQIQMPKATKYSYGAKYQMKQEILKSKEILPQMLKKYSKIDDRKKLHTVFKFYASFGDRTNIDYIKSNKIHKMLSDAQITQLSNNQIDLLFVKANRNRPNMDFDTFLYFLELLSQSLYSEENAFQYLLDNYFSQLYENIISSTDLGDEEAKLSKDIDELCIRLVQVAIQPLICIYNKYFPPHFRNFNIKDQQEELMIKSQTKSSLFLFLKDFELCPQYITKGSSCLLYDSIIADQNLPEIIQSKNKQSRFDLNKFCCYIIKLAMITFSSEENDQTIIIPLQKLAFLFERMELSQGFVNLEIPISNNKNNWKLKMPEEIIELIISDPNAIQYLNQNTQRIKINQLKNEEIQDEKCKRLHTVPTNRLRPSVHYNKQYDEYAQSLFQEYYQELYNIYRQYAGINAQTGQDNELTGSKWLKLLKDANLVNSNLTENGRKSVVQHNEVDLIFTKACSIQTKGGSVQQRQKVKQSMNFLKFLKGIQLLTTDIQQLKEIINQHILQIYCQGPETRMKDLLSQLMILLKDKEIVEFLGLLHKSILVYFKFYAIGKQTINFDQFQRFYKDFQIFPDLLSKNKIVSIFQILSKLYESQENKSGVIDQHMFVESLALAALEIQFNDEDNLSILEKIYYLIEKINQSEGPKIVQKELGHTKCPSGQDWDLLYHIKRKFNWLFEDHKTEY